MSGWNWYFAITFTLTLTLAVVSLVAALKLEPKSSFDNGSFLLEGICCFLMLACGIAFVIGALVKVAFGM